MHSEAPVSLSAAVVAGAHIIVILGGTGFMGRHILRSLEQREHRVPYHAHMKQYIVVHCNRGTDTYWGRDPLLHPSLRCLAMQSSAATWAWRHHFLDWDAEDDALRESLIALRVLLLANIMPTKASGGVAADISIIDLSCTEPRYMKALLQNVLVPLRDCIRVYLLVSTDSVYAASSVVNDNRERRECDDTSPVSETTPVVLPPREAFLFEPSSDNDACVERNEAERSHSSSESDSDSSSTEMTYGEEKRAVELLLERYLAGVDRVFLRLPDVIGPYDRSGRFWATVMWVQVAVWSNKRNPESYHPSGSDMMLLIPGSLERTKLSFVYAPDVAALVVRLAMTADQEEVSAERSIGRVRLFNIACREQYTMAEFLTHVHVHVSAAAGADHVPQRAECVVAVTHDEESPTADYYPSVECGPLDCTAAMEQLQWVPSPLQDAIRDTCRFFLEDDATRRFVDERNKALKKLPTVIRRAWLRNVGVE